MMLFARNLDCDCRKCYNFRRASEELLCHLKLSEHKLGENDNGDSNENRQYHSKTHKRRAEGGTSLVLKLILSMALTGLFLLKKASGLFGAKIKS